MRPEDRSSTSRGRRCDGGTRAEPIKDGLLMWAAMWGLPQGWIVTAKTGQMSFRPQTDPNGWPEAGSGRITVGEWSQVGGEQHNWFKYFIKGTKLGTKINFEKCLFTSTAHCRGSQQTAVMASELCAVQHMVVEQWRPLILGEKTRKN